MSESPEKPQPVSDNLRQSWGFIWIPFAAFFALVFLAKLIDSKVGEPLPQPPVNLVASDLASLEKACTDASTQEEGAIACERWHLAMAEAERKMPKPSPVTAEQWSAYQQRLGADEAKKTPEQIEEERMLKAAATIHEQFSIYVRGHDLRAKRSDGDLNVYIGKSDFQSIPFPDREDFIRSVGKVWCDAMPGGTFPSLEIYDIRTGATLGGYGCTLGNVSMPSE